MTTACLEEEEKKTGKSVSKFFSNFEFLKLCYVNKQIIKDHNVRFERCYVKKDSIIKSLYVRWLTDKKVIVK